MFLAFKNQCEGGDYNPQTERKIQGHERGPNFNRLNSPLSQQKKACKPHKKAILQRTVKSLFL